MSVVFIFFNIDKGISNDLSIESNDPLDRFLYCIVLSEFIFWFFFRFTKILHLIFTRLND